MKDIQRVVLKIVVLTCLSNFLYYGQGVGQDLHCIPCHLTVVNNETEYAHTPFLQKKCSLCHLSSETPPPDDKNHENRLWTRDEIGIGVCYKCHPKEKLGISHPVGIYPSGKIRVPDVLPTGTEGRLLCITCHSAHGSDEEYIGRKPVSAQLCIACHGRDYYQ
ncbi:MAG: cytochrome c3 family protein [bacterium]